MWCTTTVQIGGMSPDLQVKLPRDRARGRVEVDESLLLPEGRVPSPLSRAEVGLGDLGHVMNNFGASWDPGTRGHANFIFCESFRRPPCCCWRLRPSELFCHGQDL